MPKDKKDVEDLLRDLGKQKVDYPGLKKRRGKLQLWIWARTPSGCLFLFLIILSVVFLYGRIQGWW